MTGTIGIGSTDNTVASRKLYKGGKAKIIYMKPVPEKVASGQTNTDTKHRVSVIERFIKKNSGEYKKSTIWSKFSDTMTQKEFNTIIEELHRSGKIAIDKENKIGWIWNPKLAKKYRDRADLSFR